MLRITQFHKTKQEDNTSPRNDSRANERGNVLFMIMVAIALFAALNFVLNQGSRSGGESITQEKANIAASDILDYGRLIKQTVQTLQINGCNDTEISFENNKVAGYEHTPPARDECKVFHPDGGAINYIEPEESWMDSINTTRINYNTWYTTPHPWLTGLGTDGSGGLCLGGPTDGSCRELMTGVPFIKKEICLAINKKLGWGIDSNGTPYKDNGNSYGAITPLLFTGTYADGLQMGTATPSNYAGIMTGCVEGDAVAGYSFFQVLIVR